MRSGERTKKLRPPIFTTATTTQVREVVEGAAEIEAEVAALSVIRELGEAIVSFRTVERQTLDRSQ